MKKIFILFLALISMSAKAQKAEMVGNAMCCTEVVSYDGLTKNEIFARTLVALSEYEGVNSSSTAKIDVSDKESGIIIYKGKLFNGFYRQNMMYGWMVFVDFITIIECKDNKARYKFIAPSLTYRWTADNSSSSIPINEVYPNYTSDTTLKIEKASKNLAPFLPACCQNFVKAVIDLTKAYSSDF